MAEIILVEIDAHDGSSVQTLRFATQGYVTEAQRTNLLTFSEQLENAAWTSDGTATVTPNAATAPDGTTTADRIVEAIGSSWHGRYQVTTTPPAGRYTFSIHVKRTDRQWAALQLCTANGAHRYGVLLDMDSGATSALLFGTPSNPTYSVVRLANDWHRVSISIDHASGNIYSVVAWSDSATPGAYIAALPSYAGDATKGGLAWGAQLQAGYGATPYIPTTSAAGSLPANAAHANLFYDPRVVQPGNIARSIFEDARTFGRTQVGYGEVVIINADGALDGLINYGFAGQRIVLKRGTVTPNSGGVPTWTTILTGTMDTVDFTWTELVVKVRDRQQELAKPLQATRYGGTNSLPNGLDGIADDLKGKPRPLLFGKALNFAPPQVNTTRRIYELSAGLINSVDAVYDRGSALTAGAAYTSQSDMETNAPAAGQYRAWLNAAGSYIRLGSAPSGTVTVDATQGAAVANRTPAQLIKAVLLQAGILLADIASADVTALDAAASYECGIWLGPQDTAGLGVLDQLASSGGAWWGVDRSGAFRMAQVTAPLAGNSIGTLTATDIISIDRVPPRDGAGVPAWQIKLKYRPLAQVLNDLGSGVSDVVKNERREKSRVVTSNDATIKTRWPKANELEMDTCLMSATDAATEVARRLALYKVPRDTLKLRVRPEAALAATIDLGKTVLLQLPRFGMTSGKPYLVTGIRLDLASGSYDLTLWG